MSGPWPGGARPSAPLLPVAALVAGMVSIQGGAALAKSLFPLVGAAGVTALRVGFSAAILTAVWRPWRRVVPLRDMAAIALYGVVLGGMNLLFYLSLRTIPLGVAVAIEFVGPLGVALASSRRPSDLAWIGLAVLGLGLLLPLSGSAAINPAGAALALAAGLCWAFYILAGQRAGRVDGGLAVSLGMSVAALVVVPFGVAEAGTALLAPPVLGIGLAVAVLSSALPYSLEMFALRRLDRQSFSVLMSLEPAVAALAALAVLGERLTGLQWLAVACVVTASAGIASRRGTDPTKGGS